jgi:teichuronic acid biosynthesis glycosyltransferase TuaG
MIEVSVIMPAYNAMNYISESIESVVQQTYPHWELIIIDDGSTDKTKEIVAPYLTADCRIKYLWQPNGKQGKARNNGLRHANGKYVAFLDADDIWLPNKLHTQLKEIEEHRVDLVFSDAYIFESLPVDKFRKMNTVTGLFKGKEAIMQMLEINRIPILTVIVKKEALEKVGGFSEKEAIQNNEDYHLWLKLLLDGYTFYASPEITSAYRDHLGSVTNGNKLSLKESIETIQNIGELYPEFKSLLQTYLKIWFKRYYYSRNDWDKATYKKLIEQNCSYLNKERYFIWFYLLYKIMGVKVSRKVISEIVNNQRN